MVDAVIIKQIIDQDSALNTVKMKKIFIVLLLSFIGQKNGMSQTQYENVVFKYTLNENHIWFDNSKIDEFSQLSLK